MIFIISDWFSTSVSPMHTLAFLGMLLVVAMLVVLGKALCGLVDFVFDRVDARVAGRASAQRNHEEAS